MKIQVLSDLHGEFFPEVDVFLHQLKKLVSKKADILIVVGDLSSAYIRYPLQFLSENWKHVIFVPGNHDFYGSSIPDTMRELREIEKKHKNLHILQNNSVFIDGQRFVGSSLWFRETPESLANMKKLNDFRLIENAAIDIYEENRKAVQYLESIIKHNDVVITHSSPTVKSISERFVNSDINCYFVCPMRNLGHISFESPKLWIHGHTHDSFDYTIDTTRVICNPFGYYRREENPKFKAKKIIEI